MYGVKPYGGYDHDHKQMFEIVLNVQNELVLQILKWL